jgi:SAM-dependent methyltransferase
MIADSIDREKGNEYFRQIRYDLIQLVSQGENKILEIGCAEGLTGQVLKEKGKAKEVVGIEINQAAAGKAKHRIDQIILGDVEDLDLAFSQGYFDYLIMGDVIEHLVDPWSTLKNLRRFLSRTGYLLASIPNVGNWVILRDLILYDKWEYREEGLLDKGHLRFFTKPAILAMLRECGFHVVSILPNPQCMKKSKLLHAITPPMFERFLVRQYLVKAQLKSEPWL